LLPKSDSTIGMHLLHVVPHLVLILAGQRTNAIFSHSKNYLVNECRV
jgi:hypothetical protein